MVSKNTICHRYDGSAEHAIRFCAETLPDSTVDEEMRAPGDYPLCKAGEVLRIEAASIETARCG